MAAPIKRPTKKKHARKKSPKLRPLEDRIIVEIDEAETESPGGIILPKSAQEDSNFGTVIAIGPGAPWKEAGLLMGGDEDVPENGPRFPMSVAVGQRVMVGRYSGTPLEFEGRNYTILREADILAIIDE